MSCPYQGYEFGASYPDSVCIDGMLHDADHCDAEGNIYESLAYIPCPLCNRDEAIERLAEQYYESCEVGEEFLSEEEALKKATEEVDAARSPYLEES